MCNISINDFQKNLCIFIQNLFVSLFLSFLFDPWSDPLTFFSSGALSCQGMKRFLLILSLLLWNEISILKYTQLFEEKKGWWLWLLLCILCSWCVWNKESSSVSSLVSVLFVWISFSWLNHHHHSHACTSTLKREGGGPVSEEAAETDKRYFTWEGCIYVW